MCDLIEDLELKKLKLFNPNITIYNYYNEEID
jgi:hypothetical protein